MHGSRPPLLMRHGSDHSLRASRSAPALRSRSLVPHTPAPHPRSLATRQLHRRLPAPPSRVCMDDGTHYESTAVCLSSSCITLDRGALDVYKQDVCRRAVRGVHAVRQQHPHGGTLTQAGYAFEIHVEASFNLDALNKRSPYRAERTTGGCDVRVFHIDKPHVPLAWAQLKLKRKRFREYCSRYNCSQLQLISPAAPGGTKRGVRATLEYGGVTSAPLWYSALEWAVKYPEMHFGALAQGNTPALAASGSHMLDPRGAWAPAVMPPVGLI